MSFLSDLFHGNFDKLGTDITHAPASLARHPEEIAELLGGAAAIAAPFAIPELGAAFGLGGAAAGEAGGGLGGVIAGGAGSDALIGGASADALGGAAAGTEGLTADEIIGGTSQAFGGAPAAGGTAAVPVGANAAPIIPSGGIGGWFAGQNPLMLASLGVGAGTLGMRLLGGQKIPNQDQLNEIAQQAQRLAGNNAQLQAQLVSPLLTGNLPPGQAAQVQQALGDAIQTIKSRYAQLGMSGSTAEMDAIVAAMGKSQAMAGQLELQMAQAGMQAGSQAAQDLNVAGSIYQGIMQAVMQQDTQLQNAIASFAGQAGIAAAQSGRRAA